MKKTKDLLLLTGLVVGLFIQGIDADLATSSGKLTSHANSIIQNEITSNGASVAVVGKRD